MAAESKDLFAFRRGFTDLLPNRSLDYARDDSLVRNLKQLDKLPTYPLSEFLLHIPRGFDTIKEERNGGRQYGQALFQIRRHGLQ